MPLKKDYVRDFQRRVLGNATSGVRYGDSVIRDSDNRVSGRTSPRFHETRDWSGRIVSPNSADPGLLIRRK